MQPDAVAALRNIEARWRNQADGTAVPLPYDELQRGAWRDVQVLLRYALPEALVQDNMRMVLQGLVDAVYSKGLEPFDAELGELLAHAQALLQLPPA